MPAKPPPKGGIGKLVPVKLQLPIGKAPLPSRAKAKPQPFMTRTAPVVQLLPAVSAKRAQPVAELPVGSSPRVERCKRIARNFLKGVAQKASPQKKEELGLLSFGATELDRHWDPSMAQSTATAKIKQEKEQPSTAGKSYRTNRPRGSAGSSSVAQASVEPAQAALPEDDEDAALELMHATQELEANTVVEFLPNTGVSPVKVSLASHMMSLVFRIVFDVCAISAVRMYCS